MAAPAEPSPSAAWQARRLLRGARVAALATTFEGQPFASLVTPATAPDLAVLLWLSDLSEHTRHLRADPRCSLLVTATPETVNPQTAPRATITGIAAPVVDRALKARWLAMHPYAAMYSEFADFSLWRIPPQGALFVGGFGRAARLRVSALLPDAGAVAAIAAAEMAIIADCNACHPDALTALAGPGDPPRMVAVDVDGCDLAQGERVTRIDWSAPVADPESVAPELVRLARARSNGGPG